MNNIEKIIGRINEDADAQITKLRIDGANDRKALKDEYDARTAFEVDGITESAKAEAERIKERRDSAAKLAGRNMTLEMKQKVISDLFNKATETLCALPGEEYVELLASFAKSASQTGRESVVLNEKDRAAFGEAIVKRANELILKTGKKGELTLADTTRDIVGGLILSDGKIEYNCAMDAVVMSYKGELEAQTAKMLFE